MAPPTPADHQELIQELHRRLQEPDGQVERDLIQGGEVLDEACLRRWLRADDYDLKKAEKRLRAHAAWRVKFVPTGRIEENTVQRELDADKAYLSGTDKSGRPCIVVKGENHIVAQRDVDECRRVICYVLDRAIEQVDHSINPDGQLSIIFDLRGLGLANLDVPITRSVFDTLANHYPERMGVLWMFDAPFVFWGLWKCVSPFIEAETLKKIKWIYASDPSELVNSFDPTHLAVEFGGSAKLARIDHSAAAFKAKQQQQQQADGIENAAPTAEIPA